MKFNLRAFFQKKENVYLVLALGLGLIMALFNPPFSGVPDEGAHFLRAWGIAQGSISCGKGGHIDAAASGLAEELKPINVPETNDGKVSLGAIKRALFESDSREQTLFNGSICGSDPLGYVPQVIGITISRVSHIPVLWGFYLARVLNLLAAIGITYLALRLLPFGKIVLLLIALLPMTVQQYASLSYDALHISVVFLFTAYALKLSCESGFLSRRDAVMLGLTAIVAANVKYGFVPVLLLLFLLPYGKFASRKRYWIYVLSVIFGGFLVFFLTQYGAVSSDGGREGAYPLEQVGIVLRHPVGFLLIVLNTLYSGADFFLETVLYKPGWLKDSLSPVFYVSVLFGLIFLIRSEREAVRISKRQRIVLGGVFLAGLLFIFFSLYVTWSKVGGDKVQGVQGRYLLSILPLLVLAFYKSGFRFGFRRIWEWMNVSVIVFALVMFSVVFMSIWSIYYDRTATGAKYVYETYMSKERKDASPSVPVVERFQQSFISGKDNLFGVKIYVRKDVYSGQATFYLKDASCTETLREKSIDWNAKEFGSMEVKFGSVPDSKGKMYCLEGVLHMDPAFSLRMSDGVYSEGGADIDGSDIGEKDLIFDLIYGN